jgi:hypothetical protein
MGQNGRKYVEDTYEWAHVLQGFEESLAIAQERFNNRSVSLRRSN